MLNSSIPCVLLVEDNIVALHIVESLVTKAGYRFISAMDGEEALELAQSEAFDLIITDIGLPGMSGYDFTEKVRLWEAECEKKPIPIVGLTAHSTEQETNKCLEVGMNDLFPKPFTLNMMRVIENQFMVSSDKRSFDHFHDNKRLQDEKLALDLDYIERQLIELQHLPLLDVSMAMEHLGSEEMLHAILSMMVNQEIPNDLLALETAFRVKNWDCVEKLAHKMKGGALYCGTIRMKYACQNFERYHQTGYAPLLEMLYHHLFQVAEDTKKSIEQWLLNASSSML